MSTNADRTVHAQFEWGVEVVRYDRAGRWYFEKEGEKPKRATLPQVVSHVREAMKAGKVTVFLGRRGGGAFDRKVSA